MIVVEPSTSEDVAKLLSPAERDDRRRAQYVSAGGSNPRMERSPEDGMKKIRLSLQIHVVLTDSHFQTTLLPSTRVLGFRPYRPIGLKPIPRPDS